MPPGKTFNWFCEASKAVSEVRRRMSSGKVSKMLRFRIRPRKEAKAKKVSGKRVSLRSSRSTSFRPASLMAPPGTLGCSTFRDPNCWSKDKLRRRGWRERSLRFMSGFSRRSNTANAERSWKLAGKASKLFCDRSRFSKAERWPMELGTAPNLFCWRLSTRKDESSPIFSGKAVSQFWERSRLHNERRRQKFPGTSWRRLWTSFSSFRSTILPKLSGKEASSLLPSHNVFKAGNSPKP
mmetsp:Transcript_1309/g.3171  ORF Transcript_1309/g.3171 Transcript_1309/m.3171 type:complete len:238 (+) Transcript_1309:548-1261(+)